MNLIITIISSSGSTRGSHGGFCGSHSGHGFCGDGQNDWHGVRKCDHSGETDHTEPYY